MVKSVILPNVLESKTTTKGHDGDCADKRKEKNTRGRCWTGSLVLATVVWEWKSASVKRERGILEPYGIIEFSTLVVMLLLLVLLSALSDGRWVGWLIDAVYVFILNCPCQTGGREIYHLTSSKPSWEQPQLMLTKMIHPKTTSRRKKKAILNKHWYTEEL